MIFSKSVKWILNVIVICLISVLFSYKSYSYTKNEDETFSSYKLDFLTIDWIPYNVEIEDQYTFFNSNNYGYRYGPSIIKNEDGSYDLWVSSPGNNKNEWDYIRYYHSEDGKEWSEGKVVLRPTPNSKDQCSVCDPGVIFFNGYYYLAYTATDYVKGEGTNNSLFVARSKSPAGPYEKWNGESWGGNPEPIIQYKEDPNYWGVGEVSFVIKNEELYLYYTYISETRNETRIAKADLSENWPLTIKETSNSITKESSDSFDIVYNKTMNDFLAFSISGRMSENSEIIIYRSFDGLNFKKIDSLTGIEKYAHNLGVEKSKDGTIDTNTLYIGYAFGPNWGKWSMNIIKVKLN